MYCVWSVPTRCSLTVRHMTECNSKPLKRVQRKARLCRNAAAEWVSPSGFCYSSERASPAPQQHKNYLLSFSLWNAMNTTLRRLDVSPLFFHQSIPTGILSVELMFYSWCWCQQGEGGLSEQLIKLHPGWRSESAGPGLRAGLGLLGSRIRTACSAGQIKEQ